jgi:hypothetical protein
VSLYKALGGGWKDEPDRSKPGQAGPARAKT